MTNKIVVEGILRWVEDYDWHGIYVNNNTIGNIIDDLGYAKERNADFLGSTFPFIENYGKVRITIERISNDD